MKEQVSQFAKSAAFNIFSFFFLFGYTGERLITGLRRKNLILRVLFFDKNKSLASQSMHVVGVKNRFGRRDEN